MKRRTRRYILVLIFITGLVLKKYGLGLSVFLTFPALIMMSIEMLRSAYTLESEARLQVWIYILFSIFGILCIAQLQYWLSPYWSGMVIWILWMFFSVLFFAKAKSGWMQNALWLLFSFLLTTAAFMNPRQYHNFYRASRYEDYIRRHFTEIEKDVADMYIDRYKSVDSEKANSYYEKAKAELKKKNNDAALLNFNIAVDYNPEDAEIIHDRGFFKMSNLEMNQDLAYNAIKDFDRAILLNPFYSDAYFHRALMLSLIGRRDRACNDFSKAKALNPSLDVTEGLRKNCQSSALPGSNKSSN